MADTTIAGGQGVSGYSGRCLPPKGFNDVYSKQCTPGKEMQCVYYNPLAGDPYALSQMQCVYSPGGIYDYTCRLGPNKAGDACFLNAECASGVCSSRGDGEGGVGSNTCVGITEGGKCTPPTANFPDACSSGLFCDPDASLCKPVAKTGSPCKATAGCERGSVCATDGDPTTTDTSTCRAYMSMAPGTVNSVGNFLCASGTGLQVKVTPNPQYLCVTPDSTLALTGKDCDPASATQPGMECACAGSGKYLTRPRAGLGLGFNSQPYVDLNKCLLGATSPNNQLCNYDYTDFQKMRYGSCVFYACYPYYMALMNNTGGKWYAPPLQQFTSVLSHPPAIFTPLCTRKPSPLSHTHFSRTHSAHLHRLLFQSHCHL